MDDAVSVTNRCACGWEVSGPEDEVVAATIDHGRRIHNMAATDDQVRAALHGAAAAAAADPSADPASEAAAG